MIRRTVLTEEHGIFRDSVRKFLEREVVPHHEVWEELGFGDREIWLKAGENGLLCPAMPEEYGGTNELMKVEAARSIGLSARQ